ncbi:MAG: 23S rRNA (guanosine(2251)-2'-O)-methyltransferase RlmB [Rhodospirillales bacterium]|nr:MAG: 23S rRNA (guanosine(2251)-2'-O)-methyltransferase RlmB [Rhodospirillales bacterium]
MGKFKASGNRPAGRERVRHVWLWGLHAVAAALGNPARRVRRLAATSEGAARLRLLRPTDAPELIDRKALERLLPPGAVHQGVALSTDPLAQPQLAEVIDRAGDNATLVILDQVSDPHNVGAILRSAAAFGGMALVQAAHGAPSATGTVAKVASGALETVPLVTISNVARALDQLKVAAFWRIGLDSDADRTLAEATPQGRIALVLGAEGKGLRRLTREHCDLLVRLPTRPPITSLNVSNAAAVALYELTRS